MYSPLHKLPEFVLRQPYPHHIPVDHFCVFSLIQGARVCSAPAVSPSHPCVFSLIQGARERSHAPSVSLLHPCVSFLCILPDIRCLRQPYPYHIPMGHTCVFSLIQGARVCSPAPAVSLSHPCGSLLCILPDTRCQREISCASHIPITSLWITPGFLPDTRCQGLFSCAAVSLTHPCGSLLCILLIQGAKVCSPAPPCP